MCLASFSLLFSAQGKEGLGEIVTSPSLRQWTLRLWCFSSTPKDNFKAERKTHALLNFFAYSESEDILVLFDISIFQNHGTFIGGKKIYIYSLFKISKVSGKQIVSDTACASYPVVQIYFSGSSGLVQLVPSNDRIICSILKQFCL